MLYSWRCWDLEEKDRAVLLAFLFLVPYGLALYALNHTPQLGIFCLVVLFCGGFQVNATVFGALCGEVGGFSLGCGFLCILWSILFFAAVTALADPDSPVHRAWQLSRPPLTGLSVCGDWPQQDQGLYFADGAVTRDGVLPKGWQVTVSRCKSMTQKEGSWQPCEYLVLPVLSCDDDGFESGCSPKPCAWAISPKADGPITAPYCGRAKLCGWRTRLQRLEFMTGTYKGGGKGEQQLVAGLMEAGQHFHVPWDLPLLRLSNPEDEAQRLSGWGPWYLTLCFLYVPAGVLLMCLFWWRDGGHERVWISLQPESDSE